MQSLLIQSVSKAELQELIKDSVEQAVKNCLSSLVLPTSQENHGQSLSKKEAAKYLKVSIPTLTKYVKEGFVKAFRLGGARMRFRASDLDKALVELGKRR